MSDVEDPGFRLEQHIGTLLQVLVIGLLGWSLQTTVNLRTDMGIMQAKLESLQSTVSQGTNDRYRGTDAQRDFAAVYKEISRIDLRLDRCERRHEGDRNAR